MPNTHLFPWGLKECKDLVERMYDYDNNFGTAYPKTQWTQSKNPNRIELIQSARMFFKVMSRIGLNIDPMAWGLDKSKDFVIRLHPLRSDEE